MTACVELLRCNELLHAVARHNELLHVRLYETLNAELLDVVRLHNLLNNDALPRGNNTLNDNPLALHANLLHAMPGRSREGESSNEDEGQNELHFDFSNAFCWALINSSA